MKSFSISVTDAEEAAILERQADMQRMFGVSVSKSDACKSLMLSDRKHEARLFDIPVHVLMNDVAEALHSLGRDGGKVSDTLGDLQDAHRESRRLHLPQVEVKDV